MAPSNGGGVAGFLLQVLRGRWFMMFASFLIMAGAGATYLFGVYSKDIKATLGYDQSTLNLLSTCKDLGANVGVLSGLLAEVTPTWFVLLVGSAMNFGGYFLIWLAVTGKLHNPKIWQMCVFLCIGANSQNFANTGALVTCVKNFPESRGMMLGLMKGFVGLSGAMFNQLYFSIYGNDSKSLILLVAWLPAAISLVFVYTIRAMKISSHPNELKVFYQYLWISIVLALTLMALTVAQKLCKFSHTGYVASTVAVCLLMFSPLVIAFREEYATWKAKKHDKTAVAVTVVVEDKTVISERNIDGDERGVTETTMEEGKTVITTTTTVEDGKSVNKDVPCCGNICKPPKRGDDYGILQALLSFDMIILFVGTFCGLGCSLTAVDNLGQIGESLGYPQLAISAFVSLTSIWNYFGRVFAGFVSEIILQRYKIPRPLIMALALALSAVSDIIIAYPFPGSVYVASILIGFTYGAQLTLLFTIISELFGLKYFSTLFNCGQLASPIGSYVFNVQVVGKLYDAVAMKQLAARGLRREMVKELTCIGKDCYRLSFSILAATNVIGAMVLMVLVIRTRKFYRGDIYKKFRDEMAANEKDLALTTTARLQN